MLRALCVAVVLFTWSLVLAQQQSVTIPDGTRFEVVLKTELRSDKMKVGDSVKLEVLWGVNGRDDKPLLKRRDQLAGKVAAVQPLTGKDGQASIRIEVESIQTKRGAIPLRAYVISVPVVESNSINAPGAFSRSLGTSAANAGVEATRQEQERQGSKPGEQARGAARLRKGLLFDTGHEVHIPKEARLWLEVGAPPSSAVPVPAK